MTLQARADRKATIPGSRSDVRFPFWLPSSAWSWPTSLQVRGCSISPWLSWYGREIGSFAVAEGYEAHNPVGTLITYIGWFVLVVMDLALVWLELLS